VRFVAAACEGMGYHEAQSLTCIHD
jgi:hypothetical protein